MFKIDASVIKQSEKDNVYDFDRMEIVKNHKMSIAASEIYFQYINLIMKHIKYIDRESFMEYYMNITNDIEIATPPDQMFQIITDENDKRIFECNKHCEEFVRIAARVTEEDLRNTLPSTHPACVALVENPNNFETILNDVFINFAIKKYIDLINALRLDMFRNMSKVMEWTVENVSLKDFQSYLHTKRINEEKCQKYLDDYLFEADEHIIEKFYSVSHGDVPVVNVHDLMYRLTSNLDVKTDMIVIIAIYLILSIAEADIDAGNMDSKPVKYIIDVISKI